MYVGERRRWEESLSRQSRLRGANRSDRKLKMLPLAAAWPTSPRQELRNGSFPSPLYYSHQPTAKAYPSAAPALPHRVTILLRPPPLPYPPGLAPWLCGFSRHHNSSIVNQTSQMLTPYFLFLRQQISKSLHGFPLCPLHHPV
jgi:hypothetical protein